MLLLDKCFASRKARVARVARENLAFVTRAYILSIYAFERKVVLLIVRTRGKFSIKEKRNKKIVTASETRNQLS